MAVRVRRAEQVEQNREAVLAAARRVFLEKGYAGATLEGIAEEAGFSRGVMYSQFESKADLFLSLLERRIAERAAQNAAAASGLVGADALVAMTRVSSRDGDAEHLWTTALVEFRALAAREPEVNRRYAEVHERTIGHLVELLAGVHERAARAPAFPLRTMAELLLALGSGIALERAANPAALPTEDVAAIIPAALGMDGTR